MMRSFVRIGIATGLACAASAQVPPDHWVVAACTYNNAPGGLWVIDPTLATVSQPSPQSQAMAWANAVATDETGVLYYATIAFQSGVPMPNEVFAVIATPTSTTFEMRLTAGPVGPLGSQEGICALTLREQEVWFACLGGQVGYVQRLQAGQTPVMMPPCPIAFGTYLNAITTDGREIFVAVYDSGIGIGAGPTVWAIDPEAAQPTWRGVANTRVTPRSVLPSSMALGRDHTLLIAEFDMAVRVVDIDTGTTVTGPPGNFALNSGAYSPWNDQFLAGPGSGVGPRSIDRFLVGNGSWTASVASIPTSGFTSGIAGALEQPFLLFGRGCPGAGGVEPHLRWSGLPVGGGSASLRLTDAGSSPLAFCLFGLSRTQSPFGSLPLPGAAFGAPGCALHTSAEAMVAHVPQLGAATQPLNLPNSPVTRGLVLYAQWLVASPVNAAGFVSTEAVQIRLR